MSDNKKSFSIEIIREAEKLIKQEDFADAVSTLQPYKNNFYSSYRYNFALAEAYFHLNEKEKANRYLTRCLQLEPFNELALKLLVCINLGYSTYPTFQARSNLEQQIEKPLNAELSETEPSKKPVEMPPFSEDKFDNQNERKDSLETVEGKGVAKLKSVLGSLSEVSANKPVPLNSNLDESIDLDKKTDDMFEKSSLADDHKKFDFDSVSKKLSNAKISFVEEINDPTPLSEQRYSFDDDEIPIPTKHLAEIFVQQGAYKKAIKTYKALIKQNPEDKDMLLRRIEELEERSN